MKADFLSVPLGTFAWLPFVPRRFSSASSIVMAGRHPLRFGLPGTCRSEEAAGRCDHRARDYELFFSAGGSSGAVRGSFGERWPVCLAARCGHRQSRVTFRDPAVITGTKQRLHPSYGHASSRRQARAHRVVDSTSKSWSATMTSAGRIPATPTSSSASAPVAIAAARSTRRSPRRTSSPSLRPSANTGAARA
jgi:hypothetical protein